MLSSLIVFFYLTTESFQCIARHCKREHLLAAPYANSLIMIYGVKYGAESRIPNPNTKAADILRLQLSINFVLGLGTQGPNLRFFFGFG